MWREMDRLQREMNRIFEDYSPMRVRSAPSYPALNVWSNEEGLLVTAEVPGVSPEDIEVNVIATLTLAGCKPECPMGGCGRGRTAITARSAVMASSPGRCSCLSR
jgi:HSP20 family protein